MYPIIGITETVTPPPYYEITALTSNADVNQPDQIWDFSSLNLYRHNEYGAFGGAINYANRKGFGASQLYLNAIPSVNESLWFDLGYGYANKPELFANNTIYTEVYKKLNGNYVVSLGNNYKTIKNTYFDTITGSIGKYVGYYYFGFRPNHYVTKSGPDSTLLTFDARKYGDNPDQYIGVSFSTGTSPDLYDLITVNFFKVKNNIFFIQGQQPLQEKIFFIYGAGYETQKFPNQFLRRLAYLNIGLKLRVA